MLRQRLTLAFASILIALPLIVHTPAATAQATAQSDGACDRNLSQLVAGLVEAQAALSSGDSQNAIPVLRAAAAALTTIADECEASLGGTSASTDSTPIPQSVSIPGSFHAANGAFVFDYPPEWTVSDFIAVQDNSGAVSIANSADALAALNGNPIVLASGQQAVQILGGTAVALTNGEIDQGTIENLTSYFQATFEQLASTLEEPETFESNGRPASRMLFEGENFDGELVIVQLEDGARFIVIGALAAKGERDTLIPIIDSIAASLQ